MSLTRRELMQYGLSASGALLLPLQFPKKALADDTSSTTPDLWSDFKTDLSIPPVLKPYQSEGDTDYYEIVLRKNKKQFVDGTEYEFWGYNGMFPGPTIKQKQNRVAKVIFVNQLGQTDIGANGKRTPTCEDIRAVIHLHGMASLPEYDGYAEDYILPDQYKVYNYPNDRPATFWYHDHQLARTKRNVGMGLAGMWIIQDETENNLNLPKGKYDVPLIFQNPPFDHPKPTNQDAEFNSSTKDYTLINGVYKPRLTVDNCRYRFRLLNATAGHIYTLVLVRPDPDKPGKTIDCENALTVIGTDGGLRYTPVNTTTLNFVMADRYEVIIDFSAFDLNSEVALVYRESTTTVPTQITQTADIPLICFEISSDSVQDSSAPLDTLQLRPVTPVPYSVASPSHYPDALFTFKLGAVPSRCSKNGAAAINGLLWDKDIIQAYPPLGQWQKWRLVNEVGPSPTNPTGVHPVHIHLLDFQILRRYYTDPSTGQVTEKSLAPYEQNAWKDVFNLGPNETLDIAGRFGPHLGKYMMHCHNLGHEDCDMMTNFEVVDPTGQLPQPNDPITGAPAVDIPDLKDPQYEKYKAAPYYYCYDFDLFSDPSKQQNQPVNLRECSTLHFCEIEAWRLSP